MIEAIRHLNDAGLRVMFYPFVLMTQQAGNGLSDPWGAAEQPALPWRGRITGSVAPGRDGTVDGTSAADAEVAAFFGAAAPGDFVTTGERIDYVGPAEWSYRRFVLHYAHLFKLAGGQGAFCIGSELRGLTQLRGAGGTFPAVAALRALAADVRQILGPDVRIGYAADWSEYFGYRPPDGSGDVLFNLDPLWADAEIDFIGIDNYMPLSDWREGFEHLDAGWGSIHDLEYLKSNIEGGEGYDWYYATEDARQRQVRTPIRDEAYGEDWVFRYKDIRNWWQNPHHERIGGVRSPSPTAWVPGSKPIWFTEIGCPAVDKGTNAPNRFLDLRSSESGLPPFSTGRRDDLIQAQYLRAVMDYWSDAAVNPVSAVYGGPMVDTSRIFVWAWDARPHPAFPALSDTWSDGQNYYRGHWLNGRTGAVPLSATVAEICRQAGVQAVDTSGLHGLVRGYRIERAESARASLQPLVLAYGFEAVERDGTLVFKPRDRTAAVVVTPDGLAVDTDGTAGVTRTRAASAETTGRLRVSHVEADGDYRTRVAEALSVTGDTEAVSESELPLALTDSEARAVAERWLADARIARDTVTLALPPSATEVEPGALIAFDDAPERLYRVERMEDAGLRRVEASRVEPATIEPRDSGEDAIVMRPFAPPVPVLPVFLDLPLIIGDEVPHAPHLAVAARPWPGSVAVWDSATDADYKANVRVGQPARIGITGSVMPPGRPGVWQRGPRLLVRLNGTLSAADEAAVLAGANIAAIGDGSPENWELFQFTGATLVADGLWELSGFLRGQAGTEGAAADGWPKGSTFVLLDGAPVQIALAPTARGLQRHYRIGPANRGYDDPSFVHRVEAFRGIGLRPYAPCHLRLSRLPGGDLAFSWIRRTRIDGDGWDAPDVPLGEETEAYQLRLERDGTLLREVIVTTPNWTYDTGLQLADGAAGAMSLSVAQISARFGPGPATRISFDV
ncbi:MAG: host specificity protein [Alphaproteobacteria bacterium]|nr:MAG: host specificity protein [Alphaproteobacteria bacterium]